MSKKICVTKAQETAARMIVERSAKTGRAVRSSVLKIAQASSEDAPRSGLPGRVVSNPDKA